MTGTERAKAETNRASHRTSASTSFRRTVFVALVSLSGLVLFGIQRGTWRQLARLQSDYEIVSGQSFYVGVGLRTAVRSMNSTLLESVLHPEGPAWAEFQRESRNVRALLAANREHLAQLSGMDLVPQSKIDGQAMLLAQSDLAMTRYLDEMTRELEPGTLPRSEDRFVEAYLAVTRASSELLDLCQRLVAGENALLGEFLRATRHTVAEHQRLLKWSSAMTLGLALTLAAAVYRGMIAPLHQRLSETEAILSRQEKLAALGILAAGVAHEIRNPLTAIKFRLFSLRRSLPEERSSDEDLDVIAGELSRLEKIVRDFLTFARPADPAMVQLPVGKWLTEIRDLLAPELSPRNVEIVVETRDAAWIRADPQQMKQVVINLARNAAESIEGPGRITLGIATETALLGDQIRPVTIVSVQDTGRGIPPEIEKRLFDPFFSTKEGGTGLGLSIASRIVEKHGGALRYTTSINAGTTFEIVLPRVDEHAHPQAADHRG